MTADTNAEPMSTPDLTDAFRGFSRSFEQFKAQNDDRIRQIETRGAADPLTEETMARIETTLERHNARMDQLSLKSLRPALGADTAAADPREREHKAAFDRYFRSGEADGLKRVEAQALEGKALSAGSGPDGGYLVPVPAEAEILRRMALISPIRPIATVRPISTATFKKAYSILGPQSGWVAETGARTVGATPTLADLTFPSFELYAMPTATQTLLDDAVFDIEQWLASEVETVFAEQEGAAFVNGDGVTKPAGFMAQPAVANAAWVWGKLGYVATGTAGALNASNPSDALFDLVYGLKAGYRQNASFVMNRRTQAVFRKLKTSTGEYLWQAPTMAGAGATLLNFPVVEAEDMPDIGAEQLCGGVRRFPPRLPHRGPHGHPPCCATRIPPSPTCSSTPPSAWAAACRTSTRSSC